MRITSGVSIAALLALFGCASSLTPSTGAIPALTTDVTRSAKSPTYHVYTAGSTPGLPKLAVPRDIVALPNGVEWFTDIATPAIGRISKAAKFREYAAGLPIGSHPYAIVPGPDGNMWFSDEVGAVGRITPNGTITEFRSPRMVSAVPVGITVGADKALWTIGIGPPSGGPSFLFRVTLDGKITAFRTPRTLIPDGSLEADTKGNLWFFASDTNHQVYLVERTSDGKQIPQATGLMTRGEPCCPNLAPKSITIGSDGNPWFTTPYFGIPDKDGQVVGTFAGGAAKFFHIARSKITFPVYPSGIARSHQYLWYSGSDPIGTNGGLWRMTMKGEQIDYAIPYNPAGLAAANDTTLWMTCQVQGRQPQIVEVLF